MLLGFCRSLGRGSRSAKQKWNFLNIPSELHRDGNFLVIFFGGHLGLQKSGMSRVTILGEFARR